MLSADLKTKKCLFLISFLKSCIFRSKSFLIQYWRKSLVETRECVWYWTVMSLIGVGGGGWDRLHFFKFHHPRTFITPPPITLPFFETLPRFFHFHAFFGIYHFLGKISNPPFYYDPFQKFRIPTPPPGNYPPPLTIKDKRMHLHHTL